MAVPILLILFATSAAAVVAYGVHPDLAQLSSGLTIIMISRRLMWPMIAVSLILCIALIGLVISGKRRAWWLIGLAPVLALFVHRFGPGAPGPTAVVENPLFVDASNADVPEAGDYVVGLIFEDRAYAFPYRALYARPVVSIVDYDQRMLLLWSAYANRATAMHLTRELRVRDLEVVSSPANALVVYDRRLGQFVCGVTGRLLKGGDVVGFARSIDTTKATWSDWRTAHPDTLVMAGWNRATNLPNRPILPAYKLRVPPMPDPLTQVAVLATTQPAAVRDEVKLDTPANLTIGQTRVLLLRDRNGRLRAFDRHVKEDLFLTFEWPAKPSSTHKRDMTLIDVDTQTTWTLDGRAIDGQLKGERLRSIDLDDRLFWGVMKFWYPNLELIETGG
jgi:hypothetical protein